MTRGPHRLDWDCHKQAEFKESITEQERAEFEAWASKHRPHSTFDFDGEGYASPWIQAAWTGWKWQAARRAPVVLNGWKLVPDASNMTDEQAEAICNLVNCCGGGAHEVYEAALAAAPQPPEAYSNSPEFGGIKTEAAPMQMPEPAFYADDRGCEVSAEWLASDETTSDYRAVYIDPRYTDHQVRQLLAEKESK